MKYLHRKLQLITSYVPYICILKVQDLLSVNKTSVKRSPLGLNVDLKPLSTHHEGYYIEFNLKTTFQHDESRVMLMIF